MCQFITLIKAQQKLTLLLRHWLAPAATATGVLVDQQTEHVVFMMKVWFLHAVERSLVADLEYVCR